MSPPKIGELEYVVPPPQAHLAENVAREGESGTGFMGRHPAESRPGSRVELPPPASRSSPVPESQTGKKNTWTVFVHFRGTLIFGIRWPTLLRLIIQLILLSCTAAAWALIIRLASTKPEPINFPSEQPPEEDEKDPMGTNTSKIFIHVAFTILTLFQVIFLERLFFVLRAERYAYLHPSALLPTTSRSLFPTRANVNLAPWNRPPIPTYAAVLAETGRLGTGDVEDEKIRVPPPPAYGNTRGSLLLLAGYLRDSIRARRPPTTDSRPVSYNSEFEAEWKERTDAERALKLEETLATLEGGMSRSNSRN